MSHKIGLSVLASLLDGKPHRVGDWLTYWRSRIDPSKAVRKYMTNYKRRATHRQDPKPLEQQVELGGNRIILTTFSYYQRKGWLVYRQTEAGNMDDIIVQLTPLALEQMRSDKSGNAVGNRFWLEMKRAWHKGFLNVAITPTCGQEETYSEESNSEESNTQELGHASTQETTEASEQGISNEQPTPGGGDYLHPG